MKISLIAVHYDATGKNVIGFRLLDIESGSIKDVPYDSVVKVIESKAATIEGLGISRKKLKGSNGSIERYTKLIGGKPQEVGTIVILKELKDVGFEASDWKGEVKKFTYEDIYLLAEKMGIANGKLVKKEDGSVYVGAISGSYEVEEPKRVEKKAPETVEVKKVENTKIQIKPVPEGSVKPEEVSEEEVERRKKAKAQLEKALKGRQGKQIFGKPMIDSKMKEVDPVSGMSVEQKMTKAILILREVKPFYYAILANVPKIETNEVDTMAVSATTFYFNPDFVLKLTVPEIVYVMIHETMHIIMKHSLRRFNRNPMGWNIVCDLYINKMLEYETKANPTSGEIPFGRHTIKMVEGGLFNPKVDVEKDTPEKIYEEMAKENEKEKEDGEDEEGEGDGESQDGESQDGDGQGQGNPFEDENSKGKSKPGKGKGKGKGKSQGDGEEDGEEDGGAGQGEEGEEDGEKGSEDGKDGKDGDKKGSKPKKFKFRGETHESDDADIVVDDKEANKTEEQLESDYKHLMQRAKVLAKQHSYSLDLSNPMERFVEFELAPKVNWRSLLRNRMNKITQRENSFSSPDKRFVSRGQIFPGPRPVNANEIEDIKICIDTSGSITDKELGIVYNQIGQLLQQYKLDAEVIFWDTAVAKTERFKTLKDLKKIKPSGYGGTDANCVFKFIEDQKKKNRTRKNPPAIVIFTDGYFGEIKPEYHKTKDVIWVIRDNDNFKVDFGTIAPLKI